MLSTKGLSTRDSLYARPFSGSTHRRKHLVSAVVFIALVVATGFFLSTSIKGSDLRKPVAKDCLSLSAEDIKSIDVRIVANFPAWESERYKLSYERPEEIGKFVEKLNYNCHLDYFNKGAVVMGFATLTYKDGKSSRMGFYYPCYFSFEQGKERYYYCCDLPEIIGVVRATHFERAKAP